jgi:PAS domain S-box-containing protein
MAYKPQLKESLPDNRDQYYQLIEASPVTIGVVIDGKITFINTAGIRLFSASSPDQLTGRPIQDFILPDNRDNVNELFQKASENDKVVPPLEIQVMKMDGSFVDVEMLVSRFIFKDRPAIQFSMYNISRRIEMEELILQSKQDWEEIFHAITDMITLHDKDFNIIYANEAAKQKLNLPSLEGGEVQKCFKHYHGTPCPPDGCPSCGCLKSGEPANFEIFEPHLNMYIEIRSMPRFNKNNELIGLIHICRDVSRRKKQEKEIQRAKDELEIRVEERTSELKETNKQLEDEIAERKSVLEALEKNEKEYKDLSQEFHALLDGIPDNLVLLSPDLQIMWANKAAENTMNADKADIKDQYCYSICCNVVSPCENCPTLRSFTSGQEETAEVTTPKNKIWDIRSFPIKDANGEVKSVIELSRDITEKINLQAGATRSRHLASLGELAAGVAHEINNPVNNIINYAQILIDEFQEEGKDNEVPRRIIKDGDRIAVIVRSLLSFARIRKEEKSVMYLNEVFSDTLALTSAQLRKDGIHLKANISSKFLKIPIHPQQIQQVFLNMISNARYALNQRYPGTDERKILEISCEETTMDSKPYISIMFYDHGIGIPATIIDKVVNPFFSTKSSRVGTGLGLSISHGIISEHGGKMLINSVEGEYTKITINLPPHINGEK